MGELTIYHNSKCSKSRKTLALLQCFGIKPEQLVRKGEDICQAKYAGRSLSDALGLGPAAASVAFLTLASGIAVRMRETLGVDR